LWVSVHQYTVNKLGDTLKYRNVKRGNLRIRMKLRDATEDSLDEGESLMECNEAALRDSAAHRCCQNEFVSKALTSRELANRDQEYFGADEVLAELRHILCASYGFALKR
jgi:hypothetical protein